VVERVIDVHLSARFQSLLVRCLPRLPSFSARVYISHLLQARGYRHINDWGYHDKASKALAGSIMNLYPNAQVRRLRLMCSTTFQRGRAVAGSIPVSCRLGGPSRRHRPSRHDAAAGPPASGLLSAPAGRLRRAGKTVLTSRGRLLMFSCTTVIRLSHGSRCL
jgi:hypothetical protein